MENIYVYKTTNPDKDYKDNKCNAFMPSIVLSLLVIFFVVLICLISQSLMLKVGIIVGGVCVICLIFVFAFMMSPRTNIIRIQHKQNTMIAYVTNSHGISYLNLYYNGLKYCKAFNRKEDYELITANDDKNLDMAASYIVQLSSEIVANIFGILAWNLKKDNRCVTLIQQIEENQVIVVYDLRKNKLAINIEKN